MANFRPYVNKLGTTTQLADADTLVVGNGVTTSVGSLTLASAALSVIIAAGQALSVAGGAGAIDFSGSSGAFKTSTGAVTVGPGAVTVSGAASFTAAGTALSVTNNALVSGTLQATSGIVGTPSVDNAAGTLALGANTTSMAIGKVGTLATFLGDVQVNGAEKVIGQTTFDGGVKFGEAGTPIAVTAADATSFDLSGASGAFKTTTGAVTIGPGAITISGSATMQAGTLFSTTSTGNINLPNNASARFQIETVAVSANVTAANLGTLTAGSSSNADALHTHSAVGAGNLIKAGLTTTGVTTGLAGYVSANNVVSLTDNATAAKSRFLGINVGTVGSMTVGGSVTAAFTTAGGSPTAGAPSWLAAAADDGATGAGKLTATAPVAVGSVSAEVAIVIDNSGYAGAKTCVVLIQPKSIVQL